MKGQMRARKKHNWRRVKSKYMRKMIPEVVEGWGRVGVCCVPDRIASPAMFCTSLTPVQTHWVMKEVFTSLYRTVFVCQHDGSWPPPLIILLPSATRLICSDRPPPSLPSCLLLSATTEEKQWLAPFGICSVRFPWTPLERGVLSTARLHIRPRN
jgi:hypothetical protein